MRAVRLERPGAPLVNAEVPVPEPGPGEVLIRVDAAGVCHSDAHYRAGDPATRILPITLGHEIAGTVVAAGGGDGRGLIGRRVAVHYVISDGTCHSCLRLGEQFCDRYEMFGLTIDGGYAEFVTAPARNAVPVPDGIDITHAAAMMCSSSTSLHALRKGRLTSGESVAVYGVGGLGMSAVQLASALGADRVYAIDIDAERLALAARLGAVPLKAGEDAPEQIAGEGGADVALVLVPRSDVFRAAVNSLGRMGRLVAVGIGREPVSVEPYGDLISGERELIGSNDHTIDEIHRLFEFASAGSLDLAEIVTDRISLQAAEVNDSLDRLGAFGRGIRTVILPGA